MMFNGNIQYSHPTSIMRWDRGILHGSVLQISYARCREKQQNIRPHIEDAWHWITTLNIQYSTYLMTFLVILWHHSTFYTVWWHTVVLPSSPIMEYCAVNPRFVQLLYVFALGPIWGCLMEEGIMFHHSSDVSKNGYIPRLIKPYSPPYLWWFNPLFISSFLVCLIMLPCLASHITILFIISAL